MLQQLFMKKAQEKAAEKMLPKGQSPQNFVKPPTFMGQMQRGFGALQQGAENLTRPLGKARQGMFDFVGADSKGVLGEEGGMQVQLGGGGGYGRSAQDAPQMQPLGGQQSNNPMQNQQTMQYYNQMMQALKQKRGF